MSGVRMLIPQRSRLSFNFGEQASGKYDDKKRIKIERLPRRKIKPLWWTACLFLLVLIFYYYLSKY